MYTHPGSVEYISVLDLPGTIHVGLSPRFPFVSSLDLQEGGTMVPMLCHPSVEQFPLLRDRQSLVL